MPDEQLNELLGAATKSAEEQIRLSHLSMEKHLDESDRIALRRADEAISQAALQLIAADPTP